MGHGYVSCWADAEELGSPGVSLSVNQCDGVGLFYWHNAYDVHINEYRKEKKEERGKV